MGNVDFVDLLSGFKGRINRGKFWLAVLIFMIINIVAGILAGILQYASGTLGAILAFIITIAVFISGLAVAIKRLHDRDKSGWWLLLFYIAPGVLIAIGTLLGLAGMAADSAGGGILAMIFYIAGAVVGIWGFVELGCLRGTVGPNQYGPDPLAGRA